MRSDNNAYYPSRGTPKCFCGLLASPAYSEEFGLLYECHYLHNNPWKDVTEEQPGDSETVNGRESPDSDQSDNSVAPSDMVQSLSSSARQIDNPVKTICGYHIHKDAWDSFFDRECLYARNQELARHQELAICPFFNFTFCAFFDLRNSYPLSHPPPPNCFCDLPVTMRHVSSRSELHRDKLMFTCPNYLIDGARPKCTWKLWASEVPFQRPNGCTHPLQKQGTDRLLEPSRQIQSCNRKRETFNNRNSVSRGRVENNNGYNNNDDERFKLYHQPQQREVRFNGDKHPSYRRDSNHSSERFDRNHRREHDFGSRNHNYQPTFSNGSSSVSRRISNGTGSSYSQKGWDPGRSRSQPRQHIKGRKSRWDNNGSGGSHHGDDPNGQIINKNNSTDQQSSESNKSLNVDKYNVDEDHLRSENDEPKGFRDEENNSINSNDNSNDIENEELKQSVMINNSNKEQRIFNDGRNDFDNSAKICLEKDIIENSVFIGDKLQSSSDSSLRSDYSEGNGSPSSNSSRLSIEVHLKEISYIQTYDDFSQTKPAYITNRAPNCNFVAETSRLLTENQKLTSENQSLISKQENNQAEKNNFVIQVEQLKNEVSRLLGKVGHYKSEYDSEQKLRQSSQKKLIELQAQVADVTKEIDELRSLMEKEKEENAMGNMKCKVCFEGTITYALLPCYHFALCGKCSQKIDKCVICRKPKESVVRIYLG